MTSGDIPLAAGDTLVFLTDGILETLTEDDVTSIICRVKDDR